MHRRDRNGKSSKNNACDDVIVIGSLLVLEQTVSTGIVTAVRKSDGITTFQITAPHHS